MNTKILKLFFAVILINISTVSLFAQRDTVIYSANDSLKSVGKIDAMLRKNGKWISYYPNGKVAKERYYTNDIPTGVLKTWDTQGRPLVEYTIMGEDDLNTKDYRRFTYFEDGYELSKGEYKDGEKHGHWINTNPENKVVLDWYYDNGKPTGDVKGFEVIDHIGASFNGQFLNGNPVRRWTWYYPDGNVFITRTFDGSRSRTIYYNTDGSVQSEGKETLNLKKNGTWNFFPTRKNAYSIDYDEGKPSTSITYYKGSVPTEEYIDYVETSYPEAGVKKKIFYTYKNGISVIKNTRYYTSRDKEISYDEYIQLYGNSFN